MSNRPRLPPPISAAFATERAARHAMELVASTLGYAIRGHVRQVPDAWGEPGLCVLTLHVQPADGPRAEQVLGLLRGVVLPSDDDSANDRSTAGPPQQQSA